MRRAMALSIDRTAFIDILSQGQGELGGVLQPPPGGLWGMPPDQIGTLPGYDPDVQKSRNQARLIMQKLGYGPDKPLSIKVTTRDWFVYRDPAVLLIDQLIEYKRTIDHYEERGRFAWEEFGGELTNSNGAPLYG